MKTLTINSAINAMAKMGLDVNSADDVRSLISVLEARELQMSKIGSMCVRQRVQIVSQKALIKAFGADTIFGHVQSYTLTEVAERTSAATATKLKEVFGIYGLTFSEGCTYCGTSTCVAHRYGESVCGQDHSEA